MAALGHQALRSFHLVALPSLRVAFVHVAEEGPPPRPRSSQQEAGRGGEEGVVTSVQVLPAGAWSYGHT